MGVPVRPTTVVMSPVPTPWCTRGPGTRPGHQGTGAAVTALEERLAVDSSAPTPIAAIDRRRGLTPRTVQIALGWFWILDAILQLQPKMFGRTFVTGILLPNAQGQPAPLAWTITSFAHFITPDV